MALEKHFIYSKMDPFRRWLSGLFFRCSLVVDIFIHGVENVVGSSFVS